MQIKTTRCHFTPIRIVIIKKTKITCVDKDMEKLEPLYSAGGNVKFSGYIPKRNESTYSNSYLYTHAHRNFIHNSQKMEANQLSIETHG